jgi:energy-coupling factor transporter ATP-binding protein EcfA2
MSSIKIKNFGPIKEGFADNAGFLPIDKLMIFIGGQGSGKSSIVKLISTLTWLEKALAKGTILISDVEENDAFRIKWCEFQSIQNYFNPHSFIEYKGKYIHFKYDLGKAEILFIKNAVYEQPKITYIPAERNFLSVLEDLENIKGLPKSLSWTLAEFIKARRSLVKAHPIYINDIEFEYDDSTKVSYISGKGFGKLKLAEASSGIQSVVPLVVVLSYLEGFINSKISQDIDSLSFAESERFNSSLKEIDKDTISVLSEYSKRIEALNKKFLPQNLFSIIEEIEQNLFPESQKNILYKSLEFNNDKEDNHLIITTHSPYIIAYTTLAMKAFGLYEKVNANSTISERLEKIVPKKSIVDHARTGIYQIDAKGTVISIKSERGLIKDNNYLNESLAKTDDLFDDLLDIQQELCQ